MLVFFGDHLPYLGDNQLGYKELGFTEDALWTDLISYEVPYLIWTNDAAAEQLQGADADLSDRISAAFLGSAVLELTGHSENSAWFSFLNELRREYPVIHKELTLLPDGSTGSADLQTVSKWRKWSYYKLQQKTIHE